MKKLDPAIFGDTKREQLEGLIHEAELLDDSLAAAHDFVVHGDGSVCEDGCDKSAIPLFLEAYAAAGI